MLGRSKIPSAVADGTSSPRWRRPISAALTLGLLVQGGVAAEALSASPAFAAPTPANPQSPQNPQPATPTDEAPDEASALLAARLQGHRVEVTGARTEFTTLWANPDGTLTSDRSTGQVRMKAGEDGKEWVPVDTTLVQTPDGKVAPKAHPGGLVLAGGEAGVTVGDSAPGAAAKAKGAPAAEAPEAGPAEPAGPAERELVKIGSGDRQVGFGWLGKLPKPKLEGSQATYVDARPGVDLVLKATRTGFEQFLIVKNRSAVTQTGTVTIPLDTTGLNVAPQQDGSIQLLDKATGKEAVKIPAPVMWDAALDEASGEHLNRAPVTMQVRGEGADTELVFTPDAAFLADEKTRYPVTIDPVVDIGPTFDTYVQNNENFDASGSDELKLGSYNGSVKARSYLTIPGGSFNGKQVIDAKLHLYNFHSSSCTPKQWEVWDAGGAAWWTRWGNEPQGNQMWTRTYETYDVDGGDSHHCTAPDGSGWTNTDVTAMIRHFAQFGYNDYGMLLKATDENSSLSWKKFGSAQSGAAPYISITYNSVPRTPASVEIQPSQPGNPKYVADANPRFLAQAADDDGEAVKVYFDLWRGGTFIGSIPKDTPSGAWASVQASDFGLAKLDEGVQYSISSVLDDGKSRSNWVTTPFVVDTVKPGTPFVTSADYPADGLWHGAANQAGSFTFSAPAGTDDVAAYVYTLDGGTAVTVNAGTTLTTSITPTTEGRRVLSVQAKDRAGNLSPPAEYVFHVGQAGISSPVNGTQAAKRVKLAVDAQAQFKRVVYEYRRGPGATEYAVPRVNLTKADNTPVTEDKPRLADLGPHANWNVLDTLGNVGGVVQVRAKLFPEDGSGAGYTTVWNTLTVDRNADGAASAEAGPGTVNLLTGDYSTSATDVSEFGMSVTRTSSSRGTDRGWQPQGERLTTNQRQIGTDTNGFSAGLATLSRSTVRGHDSSTDSLLVTPTGQIDSYAGVGPDNTLALGMKPGRTYRLTGWIYVPGSTGLNPDFGDRGLRLAGFVKVGNDYTKTTSGKAGFTDGWQQLSVDMTVPKDATEAFFRLYNGFTAADKQVYFDDLSLREIVAPFGPQWAGGPMAGGGSDFRSLSFPQSDLVEIKGNDDASLTFAKGTDGTFFPEPGAESLTLKAVPATSGAIVLSTNGSCLEVPNGAAGNGATLRPAPCTSAPNQQWSRGDDLTLRLMGYCLDNPWGAVDNGTQLVLWGCNGGDNQKWDVRTDGMVLNHQSGKCLDADRGASIWWCWAGPNQVWDVQTSGTTYELTEPDGTKTVFDRQAGSNSYQVVGEIGPGAASATRYQYDTADGRALVKRVIPPVEAGVDDVNRCSVDPLPRGCEVMEYEYAMTTTATATAPGDHLDRVKAVKVWSWNPATSRQEAVEVAHYAYDDKGRLVETWDPRQTSPLKTGYAYDDAGRVVRTTAAGHLPWNYDFGKAAADQDPGRLLKVRREALVQGSKDQVSGETAITVVYDVPLTRAAGGPYDLAGADVARWAQLDAPTDATAVFDPEDDPGTSTAIPAKPGADGYKPAAVHYLNANGQEVNTASPSVTPGGDIDTKEYDRYGHVVRALEATNRAIALGTHPDAARYATELNLPAESAARARLLDSRTAYTADGQDVVETLGPVYRASLSEQVNGQTTPATVTAEAEKLPQLGATVPVQVDSNCCGLTWSGGAHLSVRATAAGGYDVVRVSVPEEGEYLLSGQLTKYNDHGIVQFAIDGQNLGQPIDTYAADPAVVAYATGQAIRLARGDHELKLTITGTNPASQGERFHAGLDTVTLTKTTVNPTLPAGTSVVVRDHNTNTYDEGKPDGQAYHLATTVTDGARLEGYADDAELRVTKNGYGTAIGGTAGWVVKKPTTVITDALGAKLTTTTRYDAQGHPEEIRVPGSDAADAGTTRYTYYTAGANAANAACGNRPEWAGQSCVTAPGADVTGADAARMPTTLPVKQVTRYSRTGKPEEVVETNAGKTRTTVTGYDAVDRTVSTEVTSDEGQAVPKAVTAYDPATGEVLSTTAGGKSVTMVQDVLGRTISYTDADGATTTTEYDRFSKPVKVTDPTGVTTFTYDRAKEPRGLLTSVNDSRAGEFTAKYSPDGQLVEQTYPGGIVRKDTLNASGKAVARSYTRASDGTVVWSQSNDLSTQAQVARTTSTNGTKTYSYDRLGRLVKAEQSSVATGCTTRAYTYDVHYNRTAKATSGPAGDGTCTTAGATTVNSAYDSADRVTDAGYTYDAFGRTLTTPTAAVGYRVNDLVASQETATTKQTWSLDPVGRLNGSTTAAKQADGSWSTTATRVHHFGTGGDIPRWTVENAAGAWTRNVPGTDGDLSATVTDQGTVKLQLTNLFGSVVLVTDTALTGPVLLDSDEYGNPTAGTPAARYGWLGGKQRSAEAQDGIVLMGVRLYNPATGRFLSVDPVPGGSANAYEYCMADPIGCTDLDGRKGIKDWWKKKGSMVVGKTLGAVSATTGVMGIWVPQMKAVSAVTGGLSTLSYASGGHWTEAKRQARNTVLNAAVGGFGRFANASKFAGMAGRYNNLTKGWSAGISGLAKASGASYAPRTFAARFHKYAPWAIIGGNQLATKYEYVYYNKVQTTINSVTERFRRFRDLFA
ncbi:ricin-type beta-trefoil lectin domain protein [Kitasatospora sp. NPDC002551]|uniref:ricin-type beta-trefoil lectin domain protein n=1 Tax=Kitasatospora sp. NPDC002551 TaxID=3154539 RepID=UPI003321EB39